MKTSAKIGSESAWLETPQNHLTSTWLCLSPIYNEVVSQARIGKWFVGCIARLRHQSNLLIIYDVRLQLKPDPLVQMKQGVRIHRLCTSRVDEGLHGQSVGPISKGNICNWSAAEETQTHQLSYTHTAHTKQHPNGVVFVYSWWI